MKLPITRNLTLFILISISFFLAGCLSIKPSGVKSGKNLFETFYVGDDGIQYFIKPLLFENIQNKEEIHVDFTFRYKDKVKDSVIVNLSFQSYNILRIIDSLFISNANQRISSKNNKLLFNEKRKGLIISRFTTKFSLTEFSGMFDNNDWKIIVYKNKTYDTFFSKSKTKKAIKKLQEMVFILLL